jgi:hypothetical protein
LLLLDPSSDINANIRCVKKALNGADYLQYPVEIMGAIQLFFCIENKGVAWQYKKMLIEVPEILLTTTISSHIVAPSCLLIYIQHEFF